MLVVKNELIKIWKSTLLPSCDVKIELTALVSAVFGITQDA